MESTLRPRMSPQMAPLAAEVAKAVLQEFVSSQKWCGQLPVGDGARADQ